MADTSAQLEVARWIRDTWLTSKYGQPFVAKELELTLGGRHKFNAVSRDGTVVAIISTSALLTDGGKDGSGKVQKIRADSSWLLLAEATHHCLLFTEPDMFEYWQRQRANGRLPATIELELVPLPPELRLTLELARQVAAAEVRSTARRQAGL